MKISFEGKEVNLTKDGSKYGIENLKEIAGDLYQLVNSITKRSKGGFNFLEIFQTALQVSGNVASVAGAITDLRNEVNDLSAEEINELIMYFVDRFGINNQKAYAIISMVVFETIDLIFQGIRIADKIKQIENLG